MSTIAQQYVMVDPFDIDGTELDGQSIRGAFVLGVEWAQFRERLAVEPERFAATVHSANAKRLKDMAARRGRASDATWKFGDEASNGWCQITVHPKTILSLVKQT